MGRFKVSDDKRRVQLGAYVNQALKDTLRELALQHDESLSRYTEQILANYARRKLKGVR